MASWSGSFGTNAYSSRYLAFNWNVTGQDVSGDYTDISWSFTGAGGATNNYFMMHNGYLNIDGNNVWTQGSSGIQLFNGTTVASGTYRFYHDSVGNRSFGADGGAGIYITAVNCTGSGSWDLPQIARYFSSTPSISLASMNETSYVFNWSTSETCNWIRYHLDGSSSWTDVFSGSATSGQFTVSGMDANTYHSVYAECRRQDSSLWSNSNTSYNTTYDYPKPTSVNNFNIGDGATVNLYNPLGRSCTLQLISNNDSSVIGTYSGTYSGNINSEFKTASAITAQYASIPSSKSGTYYAKVTYGSSVKTLGTGTYNTVESVCKPTMSSFKYAITDTGTKAIMGVTGDYVVYTSTANASKFIQSKTTLSFKVQGSVASGYAASIKQYRVTVGNSIYYGSSTSGEITIGDTEALSSSNTITAIIEDSRGYTGKLSFDYTINEYQTPTISIELLKRKPKSALDANQDKCVILNAKVYLPSYIVSSGYYKVWYKYKELGATSYTNVTDPLTVSVKTGELDISALQLATAFTTTKSYQVVIVGSDYYNSTSGDMTTVTSGSESVVVPIPVSSPLVSKRSGMVGINKIPTRGALDVAGIGYSDTAFISDGYIKSGTNVEVGTYIEFPNAYSSSTNACTIRFKKSDGTFDVLKVVNGEVFLNSYELLPMEVVDSW